MPKKKQTIAKNTRFYREVENYLIWCRARFAKRTVDSKRQMLTMFYQKTRIRGLSSLTNELVDRFLLSIRHGDRGAVACNRQISNIRSIVNWYREMGRDDIPINLALLQFIKIPEREQYFLSRKEIEAVIKTVDSVRVKLMIRIMFDCGLRASELARLRLSEISGQKLKFMAKGGFERITYISKHTRELLNRYLAENFITNYIFPGRRQGTPIAYNTLRYLIETPFYRAGYPKFHPHALRHSFVADLERQNAPIDEIFAMIGHRNIKTTIHYQHRIKSARYKQTLHKKYHKY